MKYAESLPVTVEIEGVEYPIDTDFRTSIHFETLLQEEQDELKIITKMLELYYRNRMPGNIPVAVEKALWFYSGGVFQKQEDEKSDSAQLYSFEYDWDYVYAAFLEQFGVDLQDVKLHWWKFRAMFSSLSEKTRFAEIIGYRSVKLSGKMPKAERDFYKKMKKIYALPRNKKTDERMQSIRERLRNGESIEDVFDL